MKMTEKDCLDLIDEIENELEPLLKGWGHYEFIEWYDNPAGFTILLSGDWSHMHLRANNIVKDIVAKHNLFVKVYETEIGQSDSDWYEAEHRYMFRKSEPKKTKAELAEIAEINNFMKQLGDKSYEIVSFY